MICDQNGLRKGNSESTSSSVYAISLHSIVEGEQTYRFQLDNELTSFVLIHLR